jgi:hypothetical protein
MGASNFLSRQKEINGGIGMKAALSCNIVRDMLPLYAEKLTSEESNIAIQQHLEQCEDCKKYLENIRKPIEYPTAPKMEIDYMRKVKRSFKRRTYILAGVISTVCIVFFAIFLRFFIIGSPLYLEDAPINFVWNYNADSKVYTIHGNTGRADTSARIKVYEDKHSNQIIFKIYDVRPSIFFPTDEFSVDIPWDGEMNIVWQGKYDQQVIISAQYMSLMISEFKDGQYKELVNVFDMDSTNMIQQIYSNSSEVSDKDLKSPFAEEQYDNYIIFALPSFSGLYTNWIFDEPSADERIFLFKEAGQYYFYKEGHPFKKISAGDVTKILDYIKKHETSSKN